MDATPDLPVLAAAPPLAPTPPGRRAAGLDAVRGFALLGILCVNLPYMLHPLAVATRPPAPDEAPSEHVAWALVRALCETKFIALFATLFGAGVALLSDRARDSGRRFWPLCKRRQGTLLLVGLAHGTLVWFGDVLSVYALSGLVLLVLHRRSTRELARLALAMLALSATIGIGLGLAHPSAPLPGALQRPTPALPAWDVVRASWDSDAPAWIDAETRAFRDGPWSEAFVFRAVYYAGSVFVELPFALPRVLGLFLMGVVLVRSGFFTDPRSPWPARALCIGAPLGLGCAALELGLSWAPGGWGAGGPSVAGEIAYEIAGLTLPFGWLGAIQLATNRGWCAGPRAWLASLGRVALTAYLAQSVVGTVLAGPAGLRWFGRATHAEMLALALGMWLAQLVLARAWLSRFEIGPAEWLWRWATYGVRPRWRHVHVAPSG